MTFIQGIIIGAALAMDAFAVSLSIGLTRGVRLYNKFVFCVSFAFFQFLFSLLGGVFGILFSKYVVVIPSVVGGIIVAVVGIMMIREGRKKKIAPILMKPRMYIILGVSVSIDALVVGFTTLNSINNYIYLFDTAMLIGIITFFFCVGANFLARYLKRVDFVRKYADYIGGLILIAFGLKMIFL